jgi:hypothetical protein
MADLSTGAPFRALFEPSRSIDDVRIHTGPRAAGLAADLDARAFTTGDHIFFGAGEYAPRTESGALLLGHELAHAAQGASPELIARDPNDPGEAGVAGAEPSFRSRLRGEVHAALLAGLSMGDDLALSGDLESAALTAGDKLDEESQSEAATVAADVGSLRASNGEGFAAALFSLQAVFEEIGAAGVAGEPAPSFAVPYLLSVTSHDIAAHIDAWVEAPGALGNLPAVVYDLQRTADASIHGIDLLTLELEGAVQELVQLRGQFESSLDRAERAELGQVIGATARQALLLNQRIGALDEQAATGAGPLEEAVETVLPQIAALRAASASERETRRELGDQPELLAVQEVKIESAFFPELFPGREEDPGIHLKPEEAFPETLDTAIAKMQGDLQERLSEQEREIDALRDAIIPPHPAFDLGEFVAVYRRWASLHSAEQEKENLAANPFMQLMGDPFKLLGTGGLGNLTEMQAGLARAWLMDIAAGQLGGTGEVATDFARQLKAYAPKARDTYAGGSAASPDYGYAETFPAGVGTTSVSHAGEQESRSQQLAGRVAETLPFRRPEMGMASPEVKHEAAVASHLLQPHEAALPIVGAGSGAADGWSYLVDVYSADPMVEDAIRREHKTLPPEVAQFLMARRQQAATLERTHRPKVRVGERDVPIGDEAMRDKGLEEARVDAAEQYLRGGLKTPLTPAMTQMRTTLAHWRRWVGANAPGAVAREDKGQSHIHRLVGELDDYFDRFFAARQTPDYRLGAVMVIANIEHGVGAKLDEAMDPGNFALAATQGLGMGLGISVLNAAGPLGQIAAQGVQKYMAVKGGSEIVAMITVASFLRNASRAATLGQARSWARMASYIADDLKAAWSRWRHASAPWGARRSAPMRSPSSPPRHRRRHASSSTRSRRSWRSRKRRRPSSRAPMRAWASSKQKAC